MHLWHELRAGERLLATGEQMLVHVDLASRSVIDDGFGNADVITGTGAINELRASSYNDTVIGSDADEYFILQSGTDVLDGGGGIDTLRLNRNGVGDAVVNLADGTASGTWGGSAFSYSLSNIERVFGSIDGTNTLVGDGGDNVLQGGSGNDTIDGGAGNDVLNGLQGDDSLQGGAGDDEIYLGNGNSQIDGGEGFDSAVVSNLAHLIKVDFTTGPNGDQLQISGEAADGTQQFASNLINVERVEFDNARDTGNLQVTGNAQNNVLKLRDGPASFVFDGGDGTDRLELHRIRNYDDQGNFVDTGISYADFLQEVRLSGTVADLQLLATDNNELVGTLRNVEESMYAGLSTEVLWKPVNSRFALGAEVNRLRQRDFGQDLGLRAYQVTTGHLSAYYDWGRGYHTQLDLGRYLAGDWGGTWRLDREFANGWRVGAYATLTDVSASEFGEGSFDKGIMVTIPLDHVFGRPVGRKTEALLQPILRDGGARVKVDGRLYEKVRSYHQPEMRKQWGRFWR